MENNLKIGPRQKYKNNICILTKKIVGVGIYGSPHVNVCSNGYAKFSTNVNNVKYSVVIKCRVRPSAIRIIKKNSDLGRS